MSSASVVCSLCQAGFDSEDALQEHNLTSCPGYDPDQPRSKLAPSRQRDTSPLPTDLTPAPPEITKQHVSVKFMWQPIADISYPKITLLAAFKNGSVDLFFDNEGGHYESSYIMVEKGKFEGQLVIGDSFVHPVKDFTVEKDDVIILELVPGAPCNCPKCQGKSQTTNQTMPPGQYKIMYFYTNPGDGPPMYDVYEQDTDNTTGTRNSRPLEPSYPRALEGRSYDPATTNRSRNPSSIDINSTTHKPVANYQSTGYQRPPQSNSGVEGANQVPMGSGGGRSDSFFSKLEPSSAAPGAGHASGGYTGGWTGGSGQRRPDIRPSSQGTDLHEQLQRAQEEKETQRLKYERETIQLQEQVQRLQDIIEIQAKRGIGGGGGGGGGEGRRDSGRVEGEGRMLGQEELISTLAEEKRAKQQVEQDLKESKDRIAALENQMEEYAGLMKDQSTTIQGAMATSKTQEVEITRLQRFMQKQQLEYSDTLSSLRKKVDKQAEEIVRVQQLNTSLSSEVDSCRTKMKRLLEELRLKEDTIVQLQERVASSSNTGANLELETMRQKYEVWREEAGKVTPLMDEVQELKEQNKYLEDMVAELKATPPSAVDPAGETYNRKSSEEYDRLRERCMELQEIRAQLERELGPLREEREATLKELSQLREMVKHPERYEKLKDENAALKEQNGQLQEALQLERLNTQRQKEHNKQLTQKLQDSSNPEQLQLVRDRLERYRQERDASRQRVEELQEQVEQLNAALAIAGSQQRQSTVLTFEMENEDDRASGTESEVTSKTHQKDESVDDPSISSSTGEVQPNALKPSADGYDTVWSDAQTSGQLVIQRPTSNRGAGDANRPSPVRSASANGPEPFSAQVNTRNGSKSMTLCRLIDPKKGMKIVAKQLGSGEYEAGTIQYVGKMDDGSTEDCVGIELELPTNSGSDGTSKNGKQYFKCAPGFGIFVPLAKVYVEQF